MRRLKTLGLIFAFAFGMKFAFVGGVHAEGNFPANSQAEEPLEERERGVIIDESGGWMKIMENHPFIEENEEELDFILLSEEFPAESGGWMKHVEDFPELPEDHPVFDDDNEVPFGIILL